MKNWNAPAVEELEVKLTASSGVKNTTEVNGGYVNGSWVDAQYDSSIYEDKKEDDWCTTKHENSAEVDS